MAKKKKAAASARVDVHGMDLSEVERLLTFMEQHGLEELEYEKGGTRIHLRKGTAQVATASRHAAPVESMAASAIAASHPAPSFQAGGRERHAEPAPADDLHTIKSPIVGTFYTAPSPDADPFVTVGASVEPGQVLCIIEAMKLMNEIEADVAGEVARIFVENGSPVEYGEALFGIRARAGSPAKK